MADILLSVGFQTGTADFSAAIKDLETAISKNPPKVKVKLEVDQAAINNFKNQIQGVLNTLSLDNGAPITLKIDNIGKITSELDAVSRKAKEAGAALKGMGRGAGDVGNVKTLSAGMKEYSDYIKKVSDELDRLKKLSSTYSGNKATSGTTQAIEFEQQVTELERLKSELESGGMTKGAFENRLSEIRARAAELKVELNDLIRVQNESDKSSFGAGSKNHQEALQKTSALLSQVRQNQEKWTAARNGKSSAAYSDLEKYAAQLEDLVSKLRSAEISEEQFNKSYDSISSGVKASSSAIRAAGEDTKTFSDRIGNLASKFSTWFSISQVIMQTVRAIRQMVSASIELDNAMTQLKIVTDESEQSYQKYLNTISDTATKIGASITDLVDSTTTYARLGYDLEESSALAEYTAMLQNVGNIDASAAQDAVTAIIKAFNVDTSEIESVMDKLVTTGNNFPISVEQIAEGMNNASSALHAAGNTFEESVALLTAANTTVQNASKASTGLRTIAARLRKTKSELDDLGEAMTDADYDEIVTALSDHNVSLTDADGSLRSTYDIIKDIAAIWGELDTMERSGLADTIAGTRQQAIFFSLVDQFREASGAMDAMANSEGALTEANDTFMESTTAHINQFKAAFTKLGSDTFTPDFLEAWIDVGATIVSILDGVMSLANAVGGLNTVLFATAGVIATINAQAIVNLVSKTLPGVINNLLSSMVSFIGVFTRMPAALSSFSSGTASASQALKALGISASVAQVGLGALIAVVGIVAVAYNHFKQAHDEMISKAKSAASDFQDAASSIDEYKSQIRTLKESLDSGNLSEEEAYNVRQQLLSIEGDIKDAYGSEAAAIDLVRMSADEATKSLDGLTASLANENLNRESTAIQEAIEQMEAVKEYYNANGVSGAIGFADANKDVTRAIKEIVDKYEHATLNFEPAGNKQWMTLSVEANAEDARETINGLATDFRQMKADFLDDGIDIDELFPSDKTFAERFETVLGNIDSVLNEYEQIYNSQILWKIAADDMYSDLMNDIQAYTDAISDAADAGDWSAVVDGITGLKEINLDDMNIDDNGVHSYFEQLIQEAIDSGGAYQVQVDLDAEFKPNKNLQSQVKYTLEKYFSDDEGKIDVNRLLNIGIDPSAGTDDQQRAYNNLTTALHGYSFGLIDVIYWMQQQGLITAQVADETKSGTDAVKGLDEAISSLSTSCSNAQQAMSEMMSGGGLSADTATKIIKELKDAGEDVSDYLSVENGKIKLNTQAYMEYARSQAEAALGLDDLIAKQAAYQAILDSNGDPDADGVIDIAALHEAGSKFDDISSSIELYKQMIIEAMGPTAQFYSLLGDGQTQMSSLADIIDAISTGGFTRSQAIEWMQKVPEFAKYYDASTNSLTDQAAALEAIANSGYNKFVERLNEEIASNTDLTDEQRNELYAMADAYAHARAEALSYGNAAAVLNEGIVGKGSLPSTQELKDAASQYFVAVAEAQASSAVPSSDDGVSQAIGAYKKLRTAATKYASDIRKQLRNLWNSDVFSDARSDLVNLAKTTGITKNDISDLAKNNEYLQYMLSESGVSAAMLAETFERLSLYGDSALDGITADALRINSVLSEMETPIANATKALSDYQNALGSWDYDDAFNGYQEAYKNLGEMFSSESGAYGADFWRTIELLHGTGHGADNIKDLYNWYKKIGTIFSEDDNGLGFLDTLAHDQSILKGLNSWVDDDSWHIDTDEFDIIADRLGITEDAVASCVNALSMFGEVTNYDIDKVADAFQHLELAIADTAGNVTISEEAVRSMLDTLGVSSWEIDQLMAKLSETGKVSFVNEGDIQSAVATIQQLTGQNWNFNLDSSSIENAEARIQSLEAYRNSLVNSDGSIKVGMEDAYAACSVLLSDLQRQKQELIQSEAVSVNISGLSENYGELQSMLMEYQSLINQYNWNAYFNLDTSSVEASLASVRGDINDTIESYGGLPDEVKTELHLEEDETINDFLDGAAEGSIIIHDEPEWSETFEKIISNGETTLTIHTQIADGDSGGLTELQNTINKLQTTPVEAAVRYTPNRDAIVQFVDECAGGSHDGEATVFYDPDSKRVSSFLRAVSGGAYDGNAKVKYEPDFRGVYGVKPPDLKGTVYYTASVLGNAGSSIEQIRRPSLAWGNARQASSSGASYASGVWGARQGGVSLTGELGREIIVDPRSGRWQTIGDYGAEFVSVPKNAIIFNHKQTEALLKYGKTDGRGIALADGNAYAGGSWSRTNPATGKSYTNSYTSSKSSSSSSSSSSSGSSSASSAASSAGKLADTLDWIEVLLDRLNRKISGFGRTASSAFKDVQKRTDALGYEIEAVNEELGNLDAAYAEYMRVADSVGISDYYKQLVQNGSISVENISDDNLKEKIEKYKEFYEKALDVKDTSEQLREDLAQLYADAFDIIASSYENAISGMVHSSTMLEKQIELIQEATSGIGSSLYDQLIQNTDAQKAKYLEELNELKSARQRALDSGEIEMYSDAWYEMTDRIEEVEEAIIDCDIATVKLISDAFDAIASGYENAIARMDHSATMIEKQIELLEESGRTIDSSFYNDLIKNSEEQKARYIAELEELKAARQKAVDSGEIEMYSDAWYAMTEKIEAAEESIIDCDIAIAKFGNAIKDLSYAKIEQMTQVFEKLLNILDSRSSVAQTTMRTIAEQGYIVSARFYENLIQNERQTRSTLVSERDNLQQQMNKLVASGDIDVGDERWLELKNKIDSVSQSIAQATLNIASFQKSIRELEWKKFDDIMSCIDDLNDEAEFFISLFKSGHDMFDKYTAEMTEQGLATFGLRAERYTTYMEMAKKYAEERARIEAQLAEDPYNTDLLARRNQLIKAQREAIQNAYAERDAIKSLVQDGIDAHLRVLKKLIDEYKDAMDSAKDLYDYQRKIEDQTKKISQLQKQLNAYQGDDSEETRKTIQQLKNDLIEAEKDLEETQYEHYISDQKKLLDKMYDDYELNLNMRFDDIDEVLAEVIASVENSASDIWDIIQSEADDVSYAITDQTATLWEGLSNICAEIDSMKQAIVDAIENATSFYDDAYEDQGSDETADDILRQMAANSAAWRSADAETKQKLHDENVALAQRYQAITGHDVVYDPSTGKWLDDKGNDLYPYKSTNQSDPSGSQDENVVNQLVKAMKENSKRWANEPENRGQLDAANVVLAQQVEALTGQYVHRGHDGVWYIGDEKLYEKYHTGGIVGGGTKSQRERLALLLDNEAVLTEEQLKSLVPDGASASTFDVLQNITKGLTFPSHDNGASSSSLEMYVTLPNVKNYEEFWNQATHDPRVSRFIQAESTDLLAGKSSLNKNKIRWG